MDYSYVITPFLAWFSAGVLKFMVNSFKAKQLAFKLIGYGGWPSNHSAIVSSVAALIALKEGVESPVFCLAITLAFIVMLDAKGLRRELGKHAVVINRAFKGAADHQPLRERMGHKGVEIFAGVIVGITLAVAVHFLSSLIGFS